MLPVAPDKADRNWSVAACQVYRRAKTAACLTAAIYSLLAYGVVSYSANIWYLVPLASGAFVGTYLTVRFHPAGR